MAEDFGFLEMQQLQVRLQEKYKEIWEPLCPENGKNQLLWLMIELGEAADIVKKEGHERVMEKKEVREHFIEELADVLMYYNDVMLCYDISAEELSRVYRKKQERNMTRW